MKDFSKNILGKIKTEKIKPISKWNFIFKKSFIWSMFGFSVVLGGFAFGSILTQISTTEWEIRHQVTKSLMHFLFLTLPYFWIVFMLGFSALAYYYLRHTSKGYKYSTLLIINSSLLISVLFGTILFATGISEKMEDTFQEHSPFYREILDQRTHLWKSPDKGLLAGKILMMINKDQIKIEDLQGKIWTVDISNAIIKKEVPLAENIIIKIIGQKNKGFFFIAKEIRPWGHFMQKMCNPNNSGIPCARPSEDFFQKMKENF